MIDTHLPQWFGLPVEEYVDGSSKANAGEIHRIGYSFEDESYTISVLREYLEQPGICTIKALVMGMPGEPGENFKEAIDLLVEFAPRMTALRGIFLGDLMQEECEMSWIEHSDITPIINAFPQLEEFIVRGSSGLELQPCSHANLKRLTLESGGMPAKILHTLAECSFPELEHFEVWLGDGGYGWDGAVTDVTPLLRTGLFPKLKTLGLRNSEIANDLAAVLSDSPILDQLDELDLSLGTMNDEGAEILLASPKIAALKKLNLFRNFLTSATIARFASLGPVVETGGQEDPSSYDDSYYVAVGE